MSENHDLFEDGDFIYVRDAYGRVWTYLVRGSLIHLLHAGDDPAGDG